MINRNTGTVWRKFGDDAVACTMIPNGVAVAAPNARRAIPIGRDAKIDLW